jgi:hypothetical protein
LARWLFALRGISMLVLLLGFVTSSTAVQLAGAFGGWFRHTARRRNHHGPDLPRSPGKI